MKRFVPTEYLVKKVVMFAPAALIAAAPVMAQSVPAIAPVKGEGASEGSANLIAASLIAGIVAIAVLGATSGDNAPISA